LPGDCCIRVCREVFSAGGRASVPCFDAGRCHPGCALPCRLYTVADCLWHFVVAMLAFSESSIFPLGSGYSHFAGGFLSASGSWGECQLASAVCRVVPGIILAVWMIGDLPAFRRFAILTAAIVLGYVAIHQITAKQSALTPQGEAPGGRFAASPQVYEKSSWLARHTREESYFFKLVGRVFISLSGSAILSIFRLSRVRMVFGIRMSSRSFNR
jgi:hypothetical protein